MAHMTQSVQKVDVLGSFANKILELGRMDSAVAIGSAAQALATIEIARQKRVGNLIDYLTVVEDNDSDERFEQLRDHIEAELGLTEVLDPEYRG